MVKEFNIVVNKTTKSRLPQVDFSNLPFGRIFSDHMFVADYANGQWETASIQPYGDMQMSPATACLHYAQAIFEGMKCNRDTHSEDILLFRPEQNARRFNRSAERMCMPHVPEELFIEGIAALMKLDREWVPKAKDSSLYIRPTMIATDPFIGVRPSATYRFFIITCPVGAYYSKPLKVKVAEQYIRAAQGGTGAAKCAGNYAGSLYPAHLAQQQGFDQMLWLDAKNFEYIEESGTMNVFFMMDNVLYTPELTGTILDGITRDSVMQMYRDRGVQVVEKRIKIAEVIAALQEGRLQEAFGAGTAVTLTPIAEIGYKGQVYQVPTPENALSTQVKKELEDIKRGVSSDSHGWIVRV